MKGIKIFFVILAGLVLASSHVHSDEIETCGGVEIGDPALLRKCLEKCSKIRDPTEQEACAEEVILRDNEENEDEPREVVVDDEGIGAEISCTSYLRDKKKSGRYSPEKAFDSNWKTAWVEGREDDGIGEKIAFLVEANKLKAATKISILPGMGNPKHFKKNNRVKKARLVIYYQGHTVPVQYFDLIGIGKKVKELQLSFKDKMEMQSFPLKLKKSQKKSPAYIFVLQILEVYKGSNWQDTCISEIVLE